MTTDDFLINLMGKELSNPDVVSFLLSVGRFKCCELGSVSIYDSVSGGVKIFFAKGISTYLEKIHFYKASKYGSYMGTLPYDVTFADSADEVERKMGTPTKVFKSRTKVNNFPKRDSKSSNYMIDDICISFYLPREGMQVFDKPNERGQLSRITITYSAGDKDGQITEGSETYQLYSFGRIGLLTIELISESKEYIN